MEIDEQTIAEILTASKEEIKRRTIETIKDKVISDISWKTSSAVSEAIGEFVKNEIAPEVKQIMTDGKGEILASLREGIIASGAALSKAMILNINKKLESEWERRAILEVFFK